MDNIEKIVDIEREALLNKMIDICPDSEGEYIQYSLKSRKVTKRFFKSYTTTKDKMSMYYTALRDFKNVKLKFEYMALPGENFFGVWL